MRERRERQGERERENEYRKGSNEHTVNRPDI